MLTDARDMDITVDSGHRTILEAKAAIAEMETSNSPWSGYQYLRKIKQEGQIRGIMLAKVLYEMKRLWSTFSGIDDSFENTIEAEGIASAQTARKYTRMWEVLFEGDYFSAEEKMDLMGKNMRSLLRMTPGIADGSLEDLKSELLTAPDEYEVRKIVREARGEQTSSGTRVTLFIDRHGILKAKRGDGNMINFGSLILNPKENQELINTAVERILGAAGVIDL